MLFDKIAKDELAVPFTWETEMSALGQKTFDNESDRKACLLYTSDAADERSSVDLGGRRIIKKKKNIVLGIASRTLDTTIESSSNRSMCQRMTQYNIQHNNR